MLRNSGFEYRIAYGCWLNDSREEPIVDENWPSIRIDSGTLNSLDSTMEFLHDAGYEYFDVFGLITNNNWTNDIVSTVDAQRQAQVHQVIEIVHAHGMKVIYGLGVYSWGFEDIIEDNVAVKGTSTQVMCASSEEAENIMQRLVDFVASVFPIDGFHLEAADQGRCNCDSCQVYDDIQYFNRINTIVAKYIRSRYPEKLLLVNLSGYLAWGDVFTPMQLNTMQSLGDVIDVFIDVGSHGLFVAKEHRRDFIARFGAAFGTANGFWIYPPQRWNRLRWFIPHFQQNIKELGELFKDGGRSCELYLAPLINPGVEITVLCNGLFLNNPTRDMYSILAESVQKLYDPKDEQERKAICEVFIEAENVFFESYNPIRNRTLDEAYSDGVEHLFNWSQTAIDRAVPGELFLERLFGVGPGYPCYLVVHFDSVGRNQYYRGMKKLLRQVELIVTKGSPSDRVLRIEQALHMVIADIELVMRDFDNP